MNKMIRTNKIKKKVFKEKLKNAFKNSSYYFEDSFNLSVIESNYLKNIVTSFIRKKDYASLEIISKMMKRRSIDYISGEEGSEEYNGPWISLSSSRNENFKYVSVYLDASGGFGFGGQSILVKGPEINSIKKKIYRMKKQSTKLNEETSSLDSSNVTKVDFSKKKAV